MTESIEAIIKPELLIWARKSAGLTLADAAKKAQVSENKLNEWETGKSTLSVSQLRKLAKVYKRPIAVFYLPEPPITFDALRDYRIIYGTQAKELSPNLRLEIRKAQYRREVALEISELLGEQIKPFNDKASIDDDPDNLSEYIRGLLDISIEDQSKWKDSYEAFNSWKNAVEIMDIIVFQTANTSKIDLKEMRGFSISENVLPVIVINSKDQPNGKIFTLIHEFVHILLHNDGICDLGESYEMDNDDVKIEKFCNQVSASVLVPKSDILKHEIVVKNEGLMIWDDQKIKDLASFFSVSQEVILRRLLTLNRTNIDFYRKKRSEYTERYSVVLEKQTDEPEDYKPPPYYRLVIRNNGLSYTG